jgi:hypothetical protein
LLLLEAFLTAEALHHLLVVVVWVSEVKLILAVGVVSAQSIREIVLVFPCVVFVAFSAIPIAQFFVELGFAVWKTFSVAHLFAFTAYPNAPIVALSLGFGVAFAVPLAVVVPRPTIALVFLVKILSAFAAHSSVFLAFFGEAEEMGRWVVKAFSALVARGMLCGVALIAPQTEASFHEVQFVFWMLVATRRTRNEAAVALTSFKVSFNLADVAFLFVCFAKFRFKLGSRVILKDKHDAFNIVLFEKSGWGVILHTQLRQGRRLKHFVRCVCLCCIAAYKP